MPPLLPRSFSRWQSAALLTGLGIALLLRHHRATILDRCRRVPAVGRELGSRRQHFDLAVRPHRSRYRISIGMEVYEDFCVVALRLRPRIPCDATLF